MTDRELLEQAAKAAGIPLKPDFKERFDYYMQDKLMWNPLTDDGDALRLAVKLSMGISIPLANKRTDVVCFSHATLNSIVAHENDPYAATRRAIVRAAAEIGKGMK